MYDTLLSRYSDMSFIMSLPVDEGFELYFKGLEKNIERQAWEQWLVAYSRMTKDTFISFQDYWKQIKGRPRTVDNRTEEEIINDAENILKSMKRSE